MTAHLSHFARWLMSAWLWCLIGIGGGFAIAPGGVLDWVYARWDDINPVVRATGTVVARDADSVTVSIRGTKRRLCEYVGANGYAVDAHGEMADVNLERVDRPQLRFTRPVGQFDAGRWRLWPIDDAAAVTVDWTYNCEGRVLVHEVVRVAVPPAHAGS